MTGRRQDPRIEDFLYGDEDGHWVRLSLPSDEGVPLLDVRVQPVGCGELTCLGLTNTAVARYYKGLVGRGQPSAQQTVAMKIGVQQTTVSAYALNKLHIPRLTPDGWSALAVGLLEVGAPLTPVP